MSILSMSRISFFGLKVPSAGVLSAVEITSFMVLKVDSMMNRVVSSVSLLTPGAESSIASEATEIIASYNQELAECTVYKASF